MFIKNFALALAFMAFVKIATAGHPPPCLAPVIASLSRNPPDVASVANACGPNAASASSAIVNQCRGQATAALRYFAHVVCPQAGHPEFSSIVSIPAASSSFISPVGSSTPRVSVPFGTSTGIPPSGPGATGGAPAGVGPTGGSGAAPAGTSPAGSAPVVGGAPVGTRPSGAAPAGTSPAGGAPPAGGARPAGSAPPAGGAPVGASPSGAPAGAPPAAGAPAATPPAGGAPAGALPAGGAPAATPPAGAPAGVPPAGGAPPTTSPAGAPAGGVPGPAPPSFAISPSSASSIHSAAPSLFTGGTVPDRQLSANMVAAAVFLGAAAAL